MVWKNTKKQLYSEIFLLISAKYSCFFGFLIQLLMDGWKYIPDYVNLFHLSFSVMCRRLYQKRRTATRKTLSATRDTTLYATRFTEFIQKYMWHNIRHYLQHYIRHTIYSIICGTLSTALYAAHYLRHYIRHTIYSIIYDTLYTALYTALPLVQHSLCLSILCVPHKTMDRHSIPNFLIYLQIVLLCIPRIRAASVLLPPACSIAWAKHASVISLLIFSWPGSS